MNDDERKRLLYLCGIARGMLEKLSPWTRALKADLVRQAYELIGLAEKAARS